MSAQFLTRGTTNYLVKTQFDLLGVETWPKSGHMLRLADPLGVSCGLTNDSLTDAMSKSAARLGTPENQHL